MRLFRKPLSATSERRASSIFPRTGAVILVESTFSHEAGTRREKPIHLWEAKPELSTHSPFQKHPERSIIRNPNIPNLKK